MKVTGIVRKVDDNGRIDLPIGLRRSLNINGKDAVELSIDGQSIILNKYKPSCAFCNEEETILDYKGKKICKVCLEGLKNY